MSSWAAAPLVAVAASGHAQVPTIVADTAGDWQLLPVDGTPGCTIALTAMSAGPERWTARPAPQCANRVPAVARVTAWRPRDGIELLDAQQNPRMTFVEDETTLLASPDLTSPGHYLIPAITGFTHVPQTAELQGNWTLARGRTACAIRLEARLIASRTTRTAVPSPACSGAARRLDHWWFEALTLLIGGPDDLLIRFRPTGDSRFAGEASARDGTMKGWSLTRPVRAGAKAK